MDHLQKFTSQLRTHLLAILFVNNLLLCGGWYVGTKVLHLDFPLVATSLLIIALVFALVFSRISTRYISQPVNFIWQTVLHLSPETAYSAAPDIQKTHLGRELVVALIAHVYQIANVSTSVQQIAADKPADLDSNFIGNSLPLPLVVLDKDMNIVFVNDALLKYTGRSGADTYHQNIYTVLDMSFNTAQTFDAWLERARESAITATKNWERVRLNMPDQRPAQLFDLIAYYNKDNPQGFEIMLVLFDRTRQYAQDDQALSFVGLAVHELRTPLTLLRGYVDVFEEELEGKLDEEMTGYMHKMKAAAQQLAAFTSNVLNVARFENDQLVLKLNEQTWAALLSSAVDDLRLRAQVRGIDLNLEIEDGVPNVGADAVSIYEVVSNLIDNAIKYSGNSKLVTIKSHVTKDGLVETTVQDFGTGIPETAIPNLFDKFYRDPHNRSQVGGTGMGLYLSKAIITAHGGNIWVRSKEGKGSTFGFTLLPYSQLADEQKTGDNADIVRTAHGWIKNHSMYRR